MIFSELFRILLSSIIYGQVALNVLDGFVSNMPLFFIYSFDLFALQKRFVCLFFWLCILYPHVLASAAAAQVQYNFTNPQVLCRAKIESNLTEHKIGSDNVIGFLTFQNGLIKKIDFNSGFYFWSFDSGGQIITDLLIDREPEKDIYFAAKSFNYDKTEISERERSASQSVLRSVNKMTGVTNWQFSFKAANKAFLYGYKDTIAVLSDTGMLFSVRKSDGRVLWQTSSGKNLTAEPSFSETFVAVADESLISVFNLADGKLEFQENTKKPVASLLFTVDGKLLWADEKGKIFRRDAGARKYIWSFKVSGKVSNLVKTEQGVLITSYDNFVYLVSDAGGRQIWKKRLAGRITLKPLVSGGFALLTSLGDNHLSILDLRTGKIVNQISLPDGEYLSSSPVLSDGRLILQTLNAIYIYTDKQENCSH